MINCRILYLQKIRLVLTAPPCDIIDYLISVFVYLSSLILMMALCLQIIEVSKYLSTLSQYCNYLMKRCSPDTALPLYTHHDDSSQ